MAYNQNTVKQVYPHITGQAVPTDDVWDIYWSIANAKVQSDGFADDNTKILAACYYIAYLASGSQISSDGRYEASRSKSIGSVSESVTMAKTGETATANSWLDRYNALVSSSSENSTVATRGRIVRFRPPLTGYRDGATARRVMDWWYRHGRL